MVRPLLAITLGDPAGIGPEVVFKSLTKKEIYVHCRPLVIGDAQILSLRNYNVSLKIKPVLNPAQASYRFGTVDVLHIPCLEFRKIQFGKPSPITGSVSARYVEKSIELAVTNLVNGLVHAPISKSAWQMAHVGYTGHTEMLADLCNLKKVAMAMVSGHLRTVMVTRHIPLAQVSQQLKVKDIVNTIKLADQWLRRLRIHRPKIGVCAFNPHAGENGLLGKEELKIIAPAVRIGKRKFGKFIFGPLPADSAFRDLKEGFYDCLITLYHDQSMIPLKLYDSNRLVNITLGLPFPRTSPGHGAAFDIAGKNRANPEPMIETILTAAKLCQNK